MYKWFEPLPFPDHDTTAKSVIVERLTSNNCYSDSNMVEKVSNKGSMEKNLMVAFVKYFNGYEIQFVPQDKPIMLVLDENSSGKGVDWIEVCRKLNIIAVVNASDTSRILQPCDQNVNKMLKNYVNELRHELLLHANFDTTSIYFNLAYALYAFEKLSRVDTITNLTKPVFSL